jgi:lipopolysaccharide transport system permease protein
MNTLTSPEQERGTPPPSAGAPPDDLPETVIEPRSGWQLFDLAELWSARELLLQLARRDVQSRYKQTVLGIAWAVLQPGMMMAVFSLFLGKLAGLSSGEIEYPLFVFAGLLPWYFFSTGLSNAANSIILSENLVTKVYFPRLALPFAAVLAALVDFCIAMSLLGILMLIYGRVPSWQVVLLPLPMAVIILCTMGVGTLLSALNVTYRDFRYVIPFMVQLWMFATPSIYVVTDGNLSNSPWINWAIALNPLNHLIAFFRAALFGQDLPWLGLAQATGLVLIAFVVGCFYFRRVEDSFADII